jgi:16S rRNA C1402 (ribose-2'-O) methylase RsmI
MIILLDIDGVLVTTPSWKVAELLADGFLKFNEKASRNLARIVEETKADIVLTTTHRISYSLEEWKILFNARGIYPDSISKLNNITTLSSMANRAAEIKEWIDNCTNNEKFVVIDDDLSINDLPNSIKAKCVLTKPLIGLDEEATQKALDILSGRIV